MHNSVPAWIIFLRISWAFPNGVIAGKETGQKKTPLNGYPSLYIKVNRAILLQYQKRHQPYMRKVIMREVKCRKKIIVSTNNLFNLGAYTGPRGSPNDLPFKNRKMEERHAGAKVSFKSLKTGMRQSPVQTL